MKTTKIVITTLIGAALVVTAGAATIIHFGVYNVAADNHHLAATYWVLDKARQHSVEAHAASIDAPPLGADKQLLVGAAHFNEMCSGCHMPPGGHRSEMAQGMYPQPPNLAESGAEMPAKQIFWTIKNGIKASGMPAWGETHSDAKLWALTALIKQFPHMSRADYEHLVQTAKARGIEDEDAGHSHRDSSAAHDHADSPALQSPHH